MTIQFDKVKQELLTNHMEGIHGEPTGRMIVTLNPDDWYEIISDIRAAASLLREVVAKELPSTNTDPQAVAVRRMLEQTAKDRDWRADGLEAATNIYDNETGELLPGFTD